MNKKGCLTKRATSRDFKCDVLSVPIVADLLPDREMLQDLIRRKL